MQNFEHTNDNPELNLSSEALKSARDELAKALILHGSISDVDPSKQLPGEQTPHQFEYVFDGEGKALVADLVFPDGDVVVSSVKAVETTPFDDVPADPDPDLGKYAHTVALEVAGTLRNEAMNTVDKIEVDVRLGIVERYYGDEIEGSYRVEHSRHGMRIDVATIPVTSKSPNFKQGKAVLEDLDALSRPLQPGDAQLIHVVADYIGQHPKIDG